ncbi:MAG TPA: sulfate permease [Thermoleophilia bacterium]|nr:sulfate permease [Thermoleophilia bacterium]
MARRILYWYRVEPPSLPIRHWLPQYERRWLRPDLVAAAAVWAVLVPEGIAYASLAGLPPEAGLFAALAPLLAYAVLGTCRQLTVGPSSAIAAYSAAAVAPLALGDAGRFIALSALLALFVGVLLLVAGLARAGSIADFFARPVLTGFVAGLALVIGVGQLYKLLGVEGGGTAFFGKLEVVVRQLGDVNLPTLVIGVAALVVIFGLRAYAPKVPAALVAVALGIAAVAVFDLQDYGVEIIGAIPDGLPSPALPSFTLADVTNLLPDAVALALICFAESVAGARALAAKHHYEVDADQELVALGVANLGAGLLQGFAVDASLSRSAVAESSGVKSQLSNIILFCFLIVTMLFLMPLFHDLPEAVLGAIVIAAVAHLVDPGALRRLRRTDATDFVLAIICFGGVLVFGLLTGLVVAVTVSLLALVYRAYRPSSAVLGRAPEAHADETLRYRGVEDNPDYETFPGLVILRVDGELFFANARWFRETVRSLVRDQSPPVREVLVHAGAVPHLDTTAAAMLKELVEELHESGVRLAFARTTTGLLHDLERNGIVALVGEDSFYDTVAAGVDDFLLHGGDRTMA